MIEIARNGKTLEPLLADVFLSRRLNTILGGAFFGPWDMAKLPLDVADQILSIDELSSMQAGMAKVDNVFARWRQKHERK